MKVLDCSVFNIFPVIVFLSRFIISISCLVFLCCTKNLSHIFILRTFLVCSKISGLVMIMSFQFCLKSVINNCINVFNN